MAKFDKIKKLQIGNHVWYFTSPQIIKWEWKSDGGNVVMRAVLRIQHEEYIKQSELLQAEENKKPAQLTQDC